MEKLKNSVIIGLIINNLNRLGFFTFITISFTSFNVLHAQDNTQTQAACASGVCDLNPQILDNFMLNLLKSENQSPEEKIQKRLAVLRILNYPVDRQSQRAEKIAKNDYLFEMTMLRLQARQNFTKGLRSATHEFPSETLFFHTILGAIAVEKTLHSHWKNPVQYVQLIESFKDPAAQLAFYNFMAMARVSTEFMRDPKLSVMHKAVYLRWVLPHAPMAIGSIASHLTGDTLRLMTSCSNQLFGFQSNEEAFAANNPAVRQAGDTVDFAKESAAIMATGEDPRASSSPYNPLSDKRAEEACASAYSTWRADKMAQRYIPSLVSLVASNMVGTELTRALLYEKNSAGVLEKRAWNKAIQNQFTKLFRGGLSQATRSQIVSALVQTYNFTPQGMYLKIAAFTLKFSNFYLMIRISEEMDMTIQREFQSAIVGGRFGLGPVSFTNGLGNNLTTNLKDIQNATALEAKNNFRYEAYRDRAGNFAHQGSGLIDYLNTFSELTASWFEINTMEFMHAQNNWLQKISTLINKETVAGEFYTRLLDDVKAPLVNQSLRDELKRTGSSNPSEVPWNEYRLMERRYPLYGIREKPIHSLPPSGDQYSRGADSPDVLEKNQLESLKIITDAFLQRNSNSIKNLEPLAATEFNSIVADLKMNDLRKIGNRLYNIRQFLTLPSHQIPLYFKTYPWVSDKVANSDKKQYDKLQMSAQQFRILISLLYTALGKPEPALYPLQGYAQSLNDSENHYDAITAIKKSFLFLNTPSFTFEGVGDWLLYSMICGPDPDDKKNQIQDAKGWHIEFYPPKIIDPKIRVDFCDGKVRTLQRQLMGGLNRLYSHQLFFPYFEIYKENKLLTNSSYTSGLWTAGDIIQKHLNPFFAKMIQNSNSNDNMNNWWIKNIRSQVQDKLNQYDPEYAQVADLLVQSFKRSDVSMNKSPFKSSVFGSFEQFQRVYLFVLGELYKTNYSAADKSEPSPSLASQSIGSANSNLISRIGGNLQELGSRVMNGRVMSFNNYVFDQPIQQFEFQRQAEKLSANLISLMNKIKILKQSNSHRAADSNSFTAEMDMLRSDLGTTETKIELSFTEDELIALRESKEVFFKELRKTFGINDGSLIQLSLSLDNPENSRTTEPLVIAIQCINGMEANFNQMVQYISLLNLMKYNKDSKENTVESLGNKLNQKIPARKSLQGG